MNPATRPTVLSAGILATAVLSVLMMMALVLVGLLGMGVGLFGVFSGEEAALPFGLAMGAGAMLVLGALMYYTAVLIACARSWNGSRGWTIALIVFSAIGLLNPGLFSLPIQILTIVGASMALGQDDRSVQSA